MMLDLNPFDELTGAADAIKGLCDRIATDILPELERFIDAGKDAIASLRTKADTDFLPMAGLAVSEANDRLVEAKGLLAAAQGLLINANAITEHIRSGKWVEVKIRTTRSEPERYDIRFRLEIEGGAE